MQTMPMKVKKELKLAQIDMKSILIVFIVIWAQLSYAQKKVDLFDAEEKIKDILSANFHPISYPDSIAIYTFYIKVTPQKNGINNIYMSSALAKNIFGNIDSLFSKTDFSKFLKGTKQKHIIIPVGILLYEHQNIKSNSKLDVWGLKDGIPKMMGDFDSNRFKAVFFSAFFTYVSTKIYN